MSCCAVDVEYPERASSQPSAFSVESEEQTHKWRRSELERLQIELAKDQVQLAVRRVDLEAQDRVLAMHEGDRAIREATTYAMAAVAAVVCGSAIAAYLAVHGLVAFGVGIAAITTSVGGTFVFRGRAKPTRNLASTCARSRAP